MTATAPDTLDPGNDIGIRKHNGFLHIARHGAGDNPVYLVSFHFLEGAGGSTRPLAVEGAPGLIQLLEQLGIDFKLAVVRGAMADILRLGSATIPELLLSDEQLAQNEMFAAMIERQFKDSPVAGSSSKQCSPPDANL